jgi:glycosyltransferase involved in cell wall biosynthesis
MDGVEPVAPERRLRIAVLSDFDGPHARSWLRWFIARGHDVHAVSYYEANEPVAGARMHALRRATSSPAPGGTSRGTPAAKLRDRMPRGVLRLLHGGRYYAAGLRGLLQRINPDVFQAHYVVEHGFYGALTRVRPLVVTAWGSDVLVEPDAEPLSRLIARWTIGRADLVTSNNAYMARRIGTLGALPSKVEVITLGAERYDLEFAGHSVNRAEPSDTRAAVIISTRAHEPLYNIDSIIDAYRLVLRSRPDARLVVANTGALTQQLRARAADLPRAEFAGMLDRAAFRDALAAAEVFLSTPSSDATSVALLQAMAAGAFPIVSDLPSQHELIRNGDNGLLVRPRDPSALADRILAALADPLLRRTAAETNRRLVEENGLNEVQMAKLEAHFYRLAGREPVRAEPSPYASRHPNA